jgi:hypothetical protein
MKQIETPDVFFSIEDGILFCSYKKQIEIDINIAKRIIKDRVEFTEGRSYPILIDFTNMHSVTKEAREYMNNPEGGLKGLLGGAFLSNSLVTTLFVNLYLRINQPSIPAKFFTKKDEAINWLKGLKVKN